MTAVWIGLGIGVLVVVAGLGLAVIAFRRVDPEARALMRRLGRLPARRKLSLAAALFRERRIPAAVRLIPPALVLYLPTPLDVIPDFIPVLGHLDDALVVAVGLALLLRFTPRAVVEEHVARLEASRT